MAAGVIRLSQRLLAMAGVVLVALACTSPDRPSVQADPIALPTPLRSFDASVGTAVGELQTAVTRAGSRLVVPTSAYRPSEPQSLLMVPRVVMRADLAAADEGYVLIYDAVDHDAAQELALELATYLGSGFGQSNFSGDTQFSVAVAGDTIVFTSWSRSRASDAEQAEAIFDAIATVGEPVEIGT